MKVKYLFFFILFLGITACEDPIDVELEEAPELLVVDAWLTESQQQSIKLSLSQNYLQNTPAIGVDDALVIVTNHSEDKTYEFHNAKNGLYIYPSSLDGPHPDSFTLGQVGDSISLSIKIMEDEYRSETVINRVPSIDSIRQEFRENELFGDDGYYCELMCRDFQGPGDTYWIKSYKNGQYLNRPAEINIAYDAAFDNGSMVDGLVFITPVREAINPLSDDLLFEAWEVGDTLNVEVHSLSNEAFFYMEILRDQLINSLNGIFAEPLYNTEGNIRHVNGNNEVLGAFNVAAVSKIEHIIFE